MGSTNFQISPKELNAINKSLQKKAQQDNGKVFVFKLRNAWRVTTEKEDTPIYEGNSYQDAIKTARSLKREGIAKQIFKTDSEFNFTEID